MIGDLGCLSNVFFKEYSTDYKKLQEHDAAATVLVSSVQIIIPHLV